ncbi:class I SAM-dependent methyltransferase [Rudaeicoccus suwonensis]|uniref:Methyltransferase family protein n=1 Tax=Rudaeicoccus suwonensis TaxID=657409 RepID=A0A561E9H1_9MICO|nr:class I SAM-dependent methyltransferase [Rudaeicoccus suwonensis]TWE12262.1 methyltransferase family protein [Rudaeicoccus suwonensis]
MTALAVAEAFSHALRGEQCLLTDADGSSWALPVMEWQDTDNPDDDLLLGLCVGMTLDVGCGPGRLTAELGRRGHVALGIDVVPEAVEQSRGRGAIAMLRDVFAPVPGEGRWHTVLLADQNIGIGGDPVALLIRMGQILAYDGRVVVEVAAPSEPTRIGDVWLDCACGRSEPFRWATVSAVDLPAIAAEAGFDVTSRWNNDRKWVCMLERNSSS